MFKKHYGQLYIYYNDEKLYLKDKKEGKKVLIRKYDDFGFKYLKVCKCHWYINTYKSFCMIIMKMFNWLFKKLNIEYFMSYKDIES